jgi:hypothetical protein
MRTPRHTGLNVDKVTIELSVGLHYNKSGSLAGSIGCEDLIKMTMESTAFSAVMQCHSGTDRRFRKTHCLHLQCRKVNQTGNQYKQA